jgi:hypothetical protein
MLPLSIIIFVDSTAIQNLYSAGLYEIELKIGQKSGKESGKE